MISTAPLLQQHNLSVLTVSSELNNRQKNLSKSNIESKSVQSSRTDAQKEIALLKQKAHQSFMQVIQMQQLHEQEVQQLRKQFQLKEQAFQRKIDSLELKIRQLEYQSIVLEKNYRHHNYNIGENELSIDNIQVISCKQDSKLDESSIWNFMQIIDSQSYQEQISSVRKEIKTQLLSIKTENGQQKNRVQVMLDKWFEYVILLKKQYVSLQEVHNNLKKKFEDHEAFTISSKRFFQSLQKENKFLGQQINRLGSQKIKTQKNMLQLQRKVKQLENRARMPANKQINKVEQANLLTKSKLELNDVSLDIDQFIQQNMAKTKANPSKTAFLDKKVKN